MHGMHLVVLNGMHLFPHTHMYTCHTTSDGHSVVDYALVHVNTMQYVNRFELGHRIPESDHVDIHMHLDFDMDTPPPRQVTDGPQRMNDTHREIYKERAAFYMHHCLPLSWADLKKCLLDAANNVTSNKRKHRKGIKGLPCKKWFDEECNAAKKHLKGLTGDVYQCATKAYHALLRKKKREFILHKEATDAHVMAKNPKKIWNEIKGHKEEVVGNFTEDDMYMYVQNLYNNPGAQEMMHGVYESSADKECFSLEEVQQALTKMHNGKACDSSGIYAEMLKWLPQEGLAYVTDMLNHAYIHGFPIDWQDNCIKALHKGGDRNELSNYRTIMLAPIMTKLFGSLLESKLNVWAEKHTKRAKGQAGFRAHHSTVDHLITLRVTMEESRRQGKPLYMCFVDFKKAFDTVPRRELMSRMQRIGVPKELQHGVQKLYEQVLCKLRKAEGFSDSFVSNMGVKQGCPLSPTLFGLYIDELEELIAEYTKQGGIDGPTIGMYTLFILLYADDVILMAHNYEGMTRLLELLRAFCDRSGLMVNVAKTKVMICSKETGKNFTYNDRPIENVTDFKYLGIEIPSAHKWSKCMDRRLAATKRMYYMLETICTQRH